MGSLSPRLLDGVPSMLPFFNGGHSYLKKCVSRKPLYATPSSYFVGRECSGKTTLCLNCVQVQSQDADVEGLVQVPWEERTRGVCIHRTRRGEDFFFYCRNLEFVFLDFGGHSIYHLAHEFFMSEPNSMVVVVLTPFQPDVDGLDYFPSFTHLALLSLLLM